VLAALHILCYRRIIGFLLVVLSGLYIITTRIEEVDILTASRGIFEVPIGGVV
jgi:hypothetical protein